MSERTRADENPQRTRTDIDKEPGEWVESAKDESMDREALSGSRPMDLVTPDMDKSPMDSDKEDFPQSDQPVNDERPHSPRSPTQR